MSKLVISKRQILHLSAVAMKNRIRLKIRDLCKENGVDDFDGKFKNALRCYENATYYGILSVHLIDKFIEIGFFHPILGKTVPLKGKIHKELTDYCPDQVLQIDFLESEFNFNPAKKMYS